jgi:glycosyltransferase involved in cell wall biosynthesis
VRILFDGSIFSSPQTGGIRRYFTNLMTRLPDDVEPWITTTHAPGLHFPRHPHLRVRRFGGFRPRKLSALAERFFFRRLERRTTFDLAHPTYYYLLSRRRLADYRCPAVITVHDMIGELFPHGTRAGEIETAKKRWAVADAERVICVSHNTKRDLMRLFGTPEEKIRVVYEASQLSFDMTTGKEQIPERPYFLFVGSHSPAYKNFSRLLRSLVQVKARYKDVLLCVVGPSLSESELVTIDELHIASDVVPHGQVDDAHLAKLYRHAVALVYPSLYEGFGIPPLEAMACQTAVIASDRSSIPEVVGDAALLVDPESEDELAEAMISLLEDRSQREELIRRGREREKLFSWDKMTAEIYEIYRDILQR